MLPHSQADLEALFQRGAALHQRGRLGEAELLYRRVQALAPRHAPAIHGLGVIALQNGQASVAVQLIAAALEILDSEPVIHANLARALAMVGRRTDALSSLDRALTLQPQFPGALVDRGNVLLDLAQPADALSSFESGLRQNPKDAFAHNGMGNALLDLRRAAESLAHFSTAICLNPDEPTFLLNRALAHSSLRHPGAALEDCRRAQQLGLATPQLHFVCANALLDLGRASEAVLEYDKALALDPSLLTALNNRGTALVALGRLELALRDFELCLQSAAGAVLQPDLNAQVRLNRCTALKDLGRRAEAWAGLEELALLAPDFNFVRGLLLHERLTFSEWRDHAQTVDAVIAAIHQDRPADAPFTFLAVSDSPSAQLACARRYVAETPSLASNLKPDPEPSAARERGQRLRIGYLSSDFREHALAYLMAGIFETHDRARFEIFAFSLGRDNNSPMGQRLRQGFDHFIEVADLQDSSIAARISDLGIDIAVDLNGYTSGNRTPVLAQRPAPLQVNYLGHPGTMGAPFMDYMIADEFVIPVESLRHYQEQIVYLPTCFQANDDGRRIDPGGNRSEAGLPLKGFVFCSFNNGYKINPGMFDIWCRLLGAVPGSVLWLLGDNATTRANLQREAQARGVAADRLIFATRQPYPRHLGRLGLADLFLDTLPFNAGTTASDALWAGVPVLTCAGTAFAARMAGSLLNAVGLPELITHHLTDYERLGLELARSPERLALLRARLAANKLSAPLFDTRAQCRHLEAAYSEMWARHQRGEKPSTLRVTPSKCREIAR